MQFILKSFDELTGEEMYKMLQLRHDVFVIEQNCIYRDMDEKDYRCYHLMAIEQGQVLGCCRLVQPGVSYDEPSIGRVCTARTHRMEGVGFKLMEQAMKVCETLWPGQPVVISAQSYLEKFYMKFGFETISKPYLEDDIPHIKMKCKKQ
ncbi:MAG TPA: GNAT family N-acetyltransferase [Flavobacteriales bacterium]|nr:GNAT family N-acetyltransferase [Flavobacteriales bacterium]